MSVPERGILQVVNFHAIDIHYNTPGLLTTGVHLYTPTSGDIVSTLGWVSITTAWDGTTPHLWVLSQGFSDTTEALMALTSIADAGIALPHATSPFPLTGIAICTDSTPLVVLVGDGAGGNPGSTMGSARVVLCVFSSVPAGV